MPTANSGEHTFLLSLNLLILRHREALTRPTERRENDDRVKLRHAADPRRRAMGYFLVICYQLFVNSEELHTCPEP